MLSLLSESHLFGETIAEHSFPLEYNSLLSVLGATTVPLRDAEPFTAQGRPATPKRQLKQIGGSKKFQLFPIDQATLNQDLDVRLRAEGWQEQPVADGAEASSSINLRGDFVRNGVFVEVEFGNAASLYRDLFKFQVASRSGVGQVGVLVVATTRMAKFFDSGVATFNQARELLPYMRLGIQMPVWIVGIQPSDWSVVEDRYASMEDTATRHGLTCHPYSAVHHLSDDAVEMAQETELSVSAVELP